MTELLPKSLVDSPWYGTIADATVTIIGAKLKFLQATSHQEKYWFWNLIATIQETLLILCDALTTELVRLFTLETELLRLLVPTDCCPG